MAVRHQNNRSQRMQSLDPYNSSTTKKTGGACFAYKSGSCIHGESCRFRHDSSAGNNESGNDIIYLSTPRLYVNNLSWDVTWQDLKGLFRREGNVTSAAVMMNADGRSKGCGIVEYSDLEAAARALSSLNGAELRGRPIYVREDRVDGGGGGGHTSAGHSAGGAGRAANAGSAAGGAGGVVVVDSCRLYVNNLAWDVSWQDLKDLFGQVGVVRRANVLTGADGRSQGCAIVEFDRIEDAARAVETMHDVEFHGRPLLVREDREQKKMFS